MRFLNKKGKNTRHHFQEPTPQFSFIEHRFPSFFPLRGKNPFIMNWKPHQQGEINCEINCALDVRQGGKKDMVSRWNSFLEQEQASL